MQIISYRKWDDIDVEFLDEHHYIKQHCTYSNFKTGQIKNPYDRTMCGVGYPGVGKYEIRISKTQVTKEYECWASMYTRCYSDTNKRRHPAYYDICEICEEWHDFQKFGQWFERNKYECDGRLHIDKDILYPGNKIYAPDKCILVPQRINMLFLNKSNNTGLPNGISKTESNKFSASYCGKTLGTFSTLEEAYSVYARNKENVIKKIADEYIKIIPTKVYDALYNYKVNIKNDRNFCT